MQVTQAVLPYMLPQHSGRIINLGSLAGKEGLPGIAAYSAASAGIIAFTKALSGEIASENVIVNCVAPGFIDTDMIRDLGQEVVDRMIQDSPMWAPGPPRGSSAAGRLVVYGGERLQHGRGLRNVRWSCALL